MKIDFKIGDRVVIHTPDGRTTYASDQFPVRGEITALAHPISVGFVCIKRDDGRKGNGYHRTWGCVPDDRWMALEREFDGSKLVVAEDDDGNRTGVLEPKNIHVMGLDKEEISKDAWKAFRDLL